MSYYTRVFCHADRFPKFNLIQAHMRSVNPMYRLETELADSGYWTDLEIHYKEGNRPILVDLSWCDEDSSVGKEEIAEFIERISPPGISIKKRKVIKFLKRTKFLICNQLLSDLDEDGFKANTCFMQFFVQGYEGMIHADDEGFYNRNGKLLLKM